MVELGVGALNDRTDAFRRDVGVPNGQSALDFLHHDALVDIGHVVSLPLGPGATVGRPAPRRTRRSAECHSAWRLTYATDHADVARPGSPEGVNVPVRL